MNQPRPSFLKRAPSFFLPRRLYHPSLPSKADIKACFAKSPSYNPGAHIFIHTPPSTPNAAAIQYAHGRFQGYSFLIDTVVEGWDPAWELDSPKAGRVFWKRASQAWAEEAVGQVYVILPREMQDGVDERGWYWWRKDRWAGDWGGWRKGGDGWSGELSILLRNEKVREIVRLDVEEPEERGWRWLKRDVGGLQRDDGRLSWEKDQRCVF